MSSSAFKELWHDFCVLTQQCYRLTSRQEGKDESSGASTSTEGKMNKWKQINNNNKNVSSQQLRVCEYRFLQKWKWNSAQLILPPTAVAASLLLLSSGKRLIPSIHTRWQKQECVSNCPAVTWAVWMYWGLKFKTKARLNPPQIQLTLHIKLALACWKGVKWLYNPRNVNVCENIKS